VQTYPPYLYCFPPTSGPADGGNSICFCIRNSLYFTLSIIRTLDKAKNPVSLSVTHHRQNPLDFVMCSLVFRTSYEDRSIVYNCCWSSPAQSFSSPRPVGLMAIFYCLRFETPSTWKFKPPYLYNPETG
jgi:hypothetical protein